MSDTTGQSAKGLEAEDSWARRYRWPLIFGGPILIILAGIYLAMTGGRYEATDDAYVDIAKAPVAASVAGRVVEVYVKENQSVKAGQPLFKLDSRDSQVGAAQAQAQYAQALLQVRNLKATYGRELANLDAVRATAAFTAREATRQRDLATAGVSSQAQAAEAGHAAQLAADAVKIAEQTTSAARANLNGDPNLPPESQPAAMAARAQLDKAKLIQSYSVVIAPVAGTVTRVEQLQPGAYVNAAQTVFWLVSGQAWIDANFKESQLAKMKIGQPAEIKVDAYAQRKLKGHVASFSPATGQAFSPIPAQNATGNWVKVIQRLPVRIEFDAPPPAMAGRGGLSAQVKVDLRPASATR